MSKDNLHNKLVQNSNEKNIEVAVSLWQKKYRKFLVDIEKIVEIAGGTEYVKIVNRQDRLPIDLIIVFK